MKKRFTSLLLLFTVLSFSQEKTNTKLLDISSGYFLGNKELSKKEFKNILSQNDKAYKEFKSGKTIQTTGIIIATASAIYLGVGIGSDSIETEGYIGGGLGLVGGLLAIIVGKSMINKSVKTYNNSVKEVTFTLETVPNGLGLAINF